MKKLLTALILCAIIIVGCGKIPLMPDKPASIPPIPDFSKKDDITEITESGRFACMDSEISVGSVIGFTKQKLNETKKIGYYLWIFDSKDVIVVEYKLYESKQPGRTWIDFDGDGKAEHFVKDPSELEFYPDICKTLNYFRELDGRQPNTERKLDKPNVQFY